MPHLKQPLVFSGRETITTALIPRNRAGCKVQTGRRAHRRTRGSCGAWGAAFDSCGICEYVRQHNGVWGSV